MMIYTRAVIVDVIIAVVFIYIPDFSKICARALSASPQIIGLSVCFLIAFMILGISLTSPLNVDVVVSVDIFFDCVCRCDVLLSCLLKNF